MCCQGTQQCTCSYHTCRVRLLRRVHLEEARAGADAQPTTPQREAPPSRAGCLCLVVLTVILVSILVAVIH